MPNLVVSLTIGGFVVGAAGVFAGLYTIPLSGPCDLLYRFYHDGFGGRLRGPLWFHQKINQCYNVVRQFRRRRFQLVHLLALLSALLFLSAFVLSIE